LIFAIWSIYKSHVINACPSGPLHLRQVRAAVSSIKLTLKTKDLVGAGRFERPTPCAQGIGTLCGAQQ
jgi:hypothetical protein